MTDVVLTSDAEVCERVAARHARTFALASRLLPVPKRRGAYAVYAFCRTADDIVDLSAAGGTHDVRERLAAFRADMHRAFEQPSSDPVLRELVWAVGEFRVSRDALEELLDGVERDLQPTSYRTWDDLTAYCAGVASSVGEMCAAIFGVPGGPEDRARAVAHARTLGLAMQITNILRDVGEDTRRGRCYFPSEELAMFDLSPQDVLLNRLAARWDRWRSFVAFQVARARTLYQDALPGIALLERDAQRCALACAAGYAEILSVIEEMDYDSVSRRAIVSPRAFVRVLTQSYLLRLPRLPDAGDALLSSLGSGARPLGGWPRA